MNTRFMFFYKVQYRFRVDTYKREWSRHHHIAFQRNKSLRKLGLIRCEVGGPKEVGNMRM